MMARILQEVGGVREDVRQISVRTEALEGALADVSLSSGEELQTGRGSESAVTMVTASSGRRERAPDQGPSQDEELHAQDNDSDVATASDALATATASGAIVAQHTAEAR
jgi:hypothetical protein